MTVFLIVCAAMLAAALLWILIPLWHRDRSSDAASSRRELSISSAVIGVAVPLLAIGMYAVLSNWDWAAAEEQTAQAGEMEEAISQLEARLAEHPDDVAGWLLLGRSYSAMNRFGRAVDAFQHAYDISRGENADAIMGLGEALFLTDKASLDGRAGQLFEAALDKAPNHPKALWYGSIAALQRGDLRSGRDRLKALLAQNPPAELQSMLQRQIQDLDQQIAEEAEGTFGSVAPEMAGGSAAEVGRAITVSVSIAPDIQRQIEASTPLFVLARDASGEGPPLAVQRHSASSAPFTVKLSERDAMMPSRTLASVDSVEVVARLSRDGTPQASSGDFYGSARFVFGKDQGPLSIIIDRTVP